jgi:hypothetical protein
MGDRTTGWNVKRTCEPEHFFAWRGLTAPLFVFRLEISGHEKLITIDSNPLTIITRLPDHVAE